MLGKRELYERSGHWAHFSDDMFPPMDLGGEQVVLRPSLCPHHALIFRPRAHSYRELPLRIAEIGGKYRAEQSGVLGGLSRVRAIQLNDAQCSARWTRSGTRPRGAGLIGRAYAALGFARPGTGCRCAARAASTSARRGLGPGRGPAAGSSTAAGLPWGPRGGGRVLRAEDRRAGHRRRRAGVDHLDRPDRLPPARTVRPVVHRRGRGRHRPVMVHRSIVGCMERVFAHLIESTAAPSPLARTGAAHRPAGRRGAGPRLAGALLQQALDQGLRARLSAPEAGQPGRTHPGRAGWSPYQAVIGEREAGGGQVAVGLRDRRRLAPRPADEALAGIASHVAEHRTALWDAA